jgi:ankyrin repeat protein
MMTPVNDDDVYKNNEKLLLSEYDDSTSLQLFTFNGDYDGVAFICTRELRDIGRRKIIKIHGETKDRRKVTVLCQAIWNGHLKIAKYLLKETDVEFKRSYPWETSPLRFSVESDDLETVKWVRKHFSVLMKTDELSYLEMVYRLPSISLEILKYFGLIYDKRSFMRRFSDGRTIIHTSVENRRCDIIDYVSSVTHRMDINTVCSKTNVSPLQLATTLNFTNVVYCLLRNQAWLPSNTFSLLKATIENGNAELFLLFVRLGANPYQLDQQCLFLVDIACRCLKLDIIHAMIIYGLDINPRITDNMFNCINRIYIGWSEDAALMFITLSVLRGTSTFPVEITNRHPKAIEYHNSLTEDDRLEIRFQGYFSESLVVRLLGEIYRGYVCATFPCAHPSSRRIIGHS